MELMKIEELRIRQEVDIYSYKLNKKAIKKDLEDKMDLMIGQKVRELNATSSIDLIFMYSESEEIDLWNRYQPSVVVTKGCKIYRR